jgi:hypothetical protein
LVAALQLETEVLVEEAKERKEGQRAKRGRLNSRRMAI